MAAADWARRELVNLQSEYHEFNPPIIPRLSYPTSISFSKQVSKGLPCVFHAPPNAHGPRNGHTSSTSVPEFPWKALAWTADDLRSLVAERVEVAVTPTGRADALAVLPRGHDHRTEEKVFLQPASIELTLSELLTCLLPPNSLSTGSPVYYLQSQNANLTTTALQSLMKDLPDNFAFAADVLGEPDARNIWIGSEKSVTSVHRDPYENLYLVLKGSKTFRLWPPVDETSMPTKLVRSGSYIYDAKKHPAFDIKLDDDADRIPWIDIDPLDPEDEKRLATSGARMRMVEVKEGEMLYLPSGWYHHVSQACGRWKDGKPAPCIAINYWYDMDYEGDRYVMRQMVSRLVEIANARDGHG